jgi:carnitine 3-dehydrogenase
MQIIGADGEYIDNGNSYFTLETHIRHLDEALVGDRVNVTTQLIEGVGKKLHIFHRLFHDDGRLLATGEHMLLHVNLKLRGSSNPSELIITRVSTIYQAHKVLPLPEGLGRAIGDSFK